MFFFSISVLARRADIKVFIFLPVLAVLLLAPGRAQSKEQEEGILRINTVLKEEYYSHRLSDKWEISKSGKDGLNYQYAYFSTSTATHEWQGSLQTAAVFNVTYNPFSFFHSSFTFEYLNGYGDRYWQPINIEHRMDNSKTRLYWKQADIRLGSRKSYLNYFKGIGRNSWEDKGDMFNLMPSQFNTEDYLRVSGYPVPEGASYNYKGRVNSLEVMWGPEIVWGYRHGYYGNYSFKYLGMMNGITVRDHIVGWGQPDERMRTYELSTKSKHMQLGALYQPFRVDKTYIDAEKTTAGQGYLGSDYIINTAATKPEDAFGGSLKLFNEKFSVFGNVSLKLTHQGLVAGNKQEGSFKFTRRFSSKISGGIEGLYRKPLKGPLPLVYGGTASNTGPALISPRGPDSPFSVDWDNREAGIVTFNFLFDKTPGSWFYLYQPDVLETWNINTEESAPIAFALQYVMTNYPTATDRLTYRDEYGNVVWEPVGASGAWATDGFLSAFKALAIINFDNMMVIAVVGAGESPATGSFAYTLSTAEEKPSTNYTTASLSLNYNDYEAKLSYAQNDWGPELWHRTFGEAIDQYYNLSFSKSFFKDFRAGVDYKSVKKVTNEYYAPEIGDFDEYKVFVHYNFGPVTAYFK